jgi:2-keto-4-pentenoate hydratase
MNPSNVASAARVLLEARRTGVGIKEFPADCKPLTAADANQIVEAVTREIDDQIAGWKITFLYKPREQPFRAPVFKSCVFSSPAKVPGKFSPSRLIEPEIVFRLTRDLPPRAAVYQAEEVAAAVEACLAFEIIATRFDTSTRTLRDMLNQRATQVEAFADHITGGAFVIGPPIKDWTSVDFAKLRISMKADDRLIVETVGGHAFVNPFLPVVVLANELRDKGGLKAGQFVATGSFSGYFPVEVGQLVVAEFEGVGRIEATFVEK